MWENVKGSTFHFAASLVYKCEKKHFSLSHAASVAVWALLAFPYPKCLKEKRSGKHFSLYNVSGVAM